MIECQSALLSGENESILLTDLSDILMQRRNYVRVCFEEAERSDSTSRLETDRGSSATESFPVLIAGEADLAMSIEPGPDRLLDNDERAMLQEIAENLAMRVLSLRYQAARHAAEIRLKEASLATIQAISTMVEQRDPYTAGHQERVSRLAEAIGRELGWDENRLEGIKVAGLLHDIGKSAIPAEILSRPGKLSVSEMELVRMHAAAGADILSGIHFDWPIQDMVRQHHERMNGSGYPDGLTGPEILPEARVLAVADVAESIMSHRPYRPALDIHAVEREFLEDHRAAYDIAAVEACLKILRQEFPAPLTN